tara:strand:+ start:34 stop:1266 length:1233 start_codon:yes stop_codon:yes gene_type:complete
VQLTLPQSEIFLNNARFRTVVAGRRFGKTYLAAAELLRAAISGTNKNCFYCSPTYGMSKEIQWQMLLDMIPEEYIAKTNETALTITLINGSIIYLKGAEKPNNLRGRALDFCVLDEFADMRPEAWFEVLRPSLSDRHSSESPTRALFIGTPKGRNHFYDLWAKGVDKQDEWASFQYTTIEGENVLPDEIDQAKSDLDERTFKQEYEAAFVTYSGLIYYNFAREETVIATAKHQHEILLIGMDFNTDPMSAVVAIRKGNTLTCVDEIVIYGSNTDEMVKEINHRYPHRQIVIFPDPAARQRKTSAGGRTDLSILQNAGFHVKAKSKHDVVRDRINSVNARLKAADGERHLFITANCKQVIKSLERQTYKEGTSIPNKDDGYDHMNDALGYLVSYLFPVQTIYDVEQPKRWT